MDVEGKTRQVLIMGYIVVEKINTIKYLKKKHTHCCINVRLYNSTAAMCLLTMAYDSYIHVDQNRVFRDLSLCAHRSMVVFPFG